MSTQNQNIPQADTHVILVSDQAAPNMLAALDSTIKPKYAKLMASKRMVHKGEYLQNVLRESGIQTELIQLPDIDNPDALSDAFMQLAVQLEEQQGEQQEGQGGTVALNLTGGTKLMALVAQSVAQASDWHSFYVDVYSDTAIWLDTANKGTRHELVEQLRLPHYLKGYGYSLGEDIQRSTPYSHDHYRLAEDMVLNVGSYERAIGTLNWLAAAAEQQQQLSVTLGRGERDSMSLYSLMDKCADAGLLHCKDNTLRFTDENARDFVKGGWLEMYVFNTLAALTGTLKIRDKAINLQVVSPRENQPNEIDVAFLARNRFFAIECKTANMQKGEKANDALYKLAENSKRIGGLGVQAMFVTYRPLNPPELRLARLLRLKVVHGEELMRLGDTLQRWVNGEA